MSEYGKAIETIIKNYQENIGEDCPKIQTTIAYDPIRKCPFVVLIGPVLDVMRDAETVIRKTGALFLKELLHEKENEYE